MIRLGIMGLGYIGRVHLAAAQSLGLSVTAVASRRPLAQRDLPDGARVFTDYDTFLREAACDAVVICLPTWLHEPYSLVAFASGRHVLCEKPLALDAAAAERMVRAADAAGVILMAAQVLRFWPHYLRLREAVAGEIEDLSECNAWRLSPYPRWAEWFSDPAKSGGALLDLQIHDLDFIYWLLGPPRRITCVGRRSPNGAWDSVHTGLQFDATLATIDASFALPASWLFSAGMRLIGRDGAYEFVFKAPANVAGRQAAAQELTFYPPAGDPRLISVPEEDAYRNQLAYFYGCVGRRQPPSRCPPQVSVAVLRGVEACRQSAAAGGQPIAIEPGS